MRLRQNWVWWSLITSVFLSVRVHSASPEFFDSVSDVSFSFYTNPSSKATHDVSVEVGKSAQLTLKADSVLNETTSLFLSYLDRSDNNEPRNSTEELSVAIGQSHDRNHSTTWLLSAQAKDAGHVTLILSSVQTIHSNITADLKDAFVRFEIAHSQPLTIVSEVIGWIYFVAWSISFYPQVYLNWRRKSVIGLNFDFLALNLAGFLCYSVFNVGQFWIDPIKAEFRKANPYDIIPVEINDVVFALHAFTLTVITIIQVFMYEKGGQRVSYTARAILAACTVAVIVLVSVAAAPSVPKFNWLDMVSGLSYIKLGITIIKYIPQVYMNFKRKSTVGWSIGNVLLDFTGGTCSIIQMFILAYNFDDWNSIFLNPVKFWLGALSIIFDIVFMVQHYCLYRHPVTEYMVQSDEI